MAKIESVPIVGASVIDASKFVKRSSEIVGNNAWWILYGPAGHGKTSAAATAATNCPTTLPAPQMTQLDGVIWWLFDRGGTDSLASLNLDAPVIDLSNCTTTQQLRGGIKAAAEITTQLGAHTVVVDTLSSLDNATLAALSPQFDGGSKFGLYNAMLAEHTETLKTARGLPCTFLFLCHSKAKTKFKEGEFREATEIKERANSVPGDFDINFDISGQTLKFMRGQCSYIIPVVAEKVGNREPDYALYPYGYPGFEYKCRYRGFAKKEKPNLYRMMQMVKGGSK